MSRHTSKSSTNASTYLVKASNEVPFTRVQQDFSLLLTAPCRLNRRGQKLRPLTVAETILFMDYKKYASVHAEVAENFCEHQPNAVIFKLNYKEDVPLPIDKVYWKTGNVLRKADSWIGSGDRCTLRKHAWDVVENKDLLREENENVLVQVMDGVLIAEDLPQPRFAAQFTGDGTPNYLELLNRLIDLYANFQSKSSALAVVRNKTISYYEKNIMNPHEGQGKHPAFGAVVYILGELNKVMKDADLSTAVQRILETDVFESFLVTPLVNTRLQHIKMEDNVKVRQCTLSGEIVEYGYSRPTNALDILKNVLPVGHRENQATEEENPGEEGDEEGGEEEKSGDAVLLPECVLFYNDNRVVRAWFRLKALS